MTGAPAAGDRLATLAAWLAGGGWPAAGVLAVAAVGLLASLLLPGAVLLLPLALVCNLATAGFLAVESGLAATLRSLLMGAVLLAPLLLVGVGLLGPALLFAWLPGLAAGAALRASRSLPLALLTLTALAALVVVMVQRTGLPAGQPDVRAALVENLRRFNPQLPAAELDAALGVMLQLAGGLLALVLLSAWSGGLCLARSLQARLHRPGAFAQEFRALRFGRVYAVLLLPVLVAAFAWRLAADGLAVELALVLAVPALLQGLALVHGETARRGWWPRLPWVVYALLVVATPQLGSALVLLGLMDNWVDFRSRPLR
ncbi:MAG: hypothetical protein AB7N69_06280 [Immundisolibacter sp.]|uniref:hypothetical protein n=1 Tax=Immundisolibacter sp. TaxID=1934948 RepID=UPI003D1206FB